MAHLRFQDKDWEYCTKQILGVERKEVTFTAVKVLHPTNRLIVTE